MSTGSASATSSSCTSSWHCRACEEGEHAAAGSLALLRSQTLSALHEAVHLGELEREEARDLLSRVGPPGMKIRLLGDAVLRRVAWELADQLGWISTYDAEYVALTRLQADAFITLDQGWREASKGSSHSPHSMRSDEGAPRPRLRRDGST